MTDFYKILDEREKNELQEFHDSIFNPDGTWKLNESYQSILELDRILTEKKIPHKLKRNMDGWIIVYPEDGQRIKGDVIEHMGSYGHEEDLMEAYGFDLPDVEGFLDVEAALKFFVKAHRKQKWNEFKTSIMNHFTRVE